MKFATLPHYRTCTRLCVRVLDPTDVRIISHTGAWHQHQHHTYIRSLYICTIAIYMGIHTVASSHQCGSMPSECGVKQPARSGGSPVQTLTSICIKSQPTITPVELRPSKELLKVVVYNYGTKCVSPCMLVLFELNYLSILSMLHSWVSL